MKKPASQTESAAVPPLLQTPLTALHRALGAKLVPFAGYEMPVTFAGILAEHLAVRSGAGLFDVSHMGQASLIGAGAIAALERLVPGDIAALADGQMRYTLLTQDDGGIRDDLMVTRLGPEHLFLVVNAACKDDDFAWIESQLPSGVRLECHEDRALLALQGPRAVELLARFDPPIAAMKFMTARDAHLERVDALVTRSGYTGEDGFEISLAADEAETFARRLLDGDAAMPIGLGARDSLRLEAGLCLYGHDIDRTTSPIEAGLGWTISKRRRAEGGFPGAHIIQAQLGHDTAKKRVGIRPDGRAPAREGTPIVDANGASIGNVTSGGYGPSVEAPIAMGYVDIAHAAIGTTVALMVRGKALPATIAKLPFVPHRYVKH